MKAEHRKELETNTLADKMGTVMQRVKTGRRSTFLLYVAIGGAIIIGAWFAYISIVGGREDRSSSWVRLDDAGRANLTALATSGERDTPASKAALLQIAWLYYWEFGVKRLGAEPADAMEKINLASTAYQDLAKRCADDPIFEPQALLGFAVTEETKAIQDPAFLEKAVDAYKAVVDKYDKEGKICAESEFAKERLTKLNDKKQRGEIAATYEEMRKGLGVRVPLANLPFGPAGLLDKKKD